MALVEGDTPVHTFHVSTGTGGTPTVLGNYRFYLKQPGYNSKRMYYSVYFIGGYATHGYSSVPNGAPATAASGTRSVQPVHLQLDRSWRPDAPVVGPSPDSSAFAAN